MIPVNIKSYLDERGIPYREAAHTFRATAQETAQAAHVSGKRFGKTVVLRCDDKYVIDLLPANESVDLEVVGNLLGGKAELASEQELTRMFPDCEMGAMPPLGGLYGLPVFADACLAQQETIAVNGGSHTDMIELGWDDFVRCENPRMVRH